MIIFFIEKDIFIFYFTNINDKDENNLLQKKKKKEEKITLIKTINVVNIIGGSHHLQLAAGRVLFSHQFSWTSL